MNERHIVLLLVVITLLASASIRLYQLAYPTSFAFDETYYAKDAQTIIRGDLGPVKDYAWEPGSEVSWPHPEYGKLLIAAGIKIFGDDSRGWRVAPLIAGMALLMLVYPIARRLRLPRVWALAALVLAAADGLLIAQSRIATLDVFLALWTMLCIYLALRYVQSSARWRVAWLVLAGIAGGLGFGTKWSGAFALVAAFTVIVLMQKRKVDADAGRAQVPGTVLWGAATVVYAVLALVVAWLLVGGGVAGWDFLADRVFHGRGRLPVSLADVVTNVLMLGAAALAVYVQLQRRPAAGAVTPLPRVVLRAAFAALCAALAAVVSWLGFYVTALIIHHGDRWWHFGLTNHYGMVWTILAAAGLVAVVVLLVLGAAMPALRPWLRRSFGEGALIVLFFGVVPVALYAASYTLYFTHGHSFADWRELHSQMWYFNVNLTAPHGYASQSYTWIFDKRPVWYYYVESPKVRGIVGMGNPLLWWASSLALIGLAGAAIVRRDIRLALTSIIVAVLYLPWLRVSDMHVRILFHTLAIGDPRTSFMYYMTPVVPFMAIGVASALALLAGPTRVACRWPVIAVVASAGAFYFLWHPVGQVAKWLFWTVPGHIASGLPAIVTGAAIACVVAAAIVLVFLPRLRFVWRYLSWVCVGLVVGIGLVYLPIIIALPISREHFYDLMWFRSWI